jgi:hypothetical protein
MDKLVTREILIEEELKKSNSLKQNNKEIEIPKPNTFHSHFVVHILKNKNEKCEQLVLFRFQVFEQVKDFMVNIEIDENDINDRYSYDDATQ